MAIREDAFGIVKNIVLGVPEESTPTYDILNGEKEQDLLDKYDDSTFVHGMLDIKKKSTESLQEYETRVEKIRKAALHVAHQLLRDKYINGVDLAGAAPLNEKESSVLETALGEKLKNKWKNWYKK